MLLPFSLLRIILIHRVEEQGGHVAGAELVRGKAEVREADWEVIQTCGSL